MTPLRQRMLEDMSIRNFAENTQQSYLQQVSSFARYFHCSPDALGPEKVREYQVHLVEGRKLAPSSISIAVSALRFLYKVTLRQPWSSDDIPMPKKPFKLPVILSPEEVMRFLESVHSMKHRAILMAAYAAGLRVSEATHLKVTDIDSQRMMLRVDQGKGGKDRYVMLSPRLLQELRSYWRAGRPKTWLFPGDVEGQPITRDAVGQACQRARRSCGIQKPITPHSLRHAFATHLLEMDTNLADIQALLGHASIRSTQRYAQVSRARLAKTKSPLDLLGTPEGKKTLG